MTDHKGSVAETGKDRLAGLFRVIGAIERAGNKLPHPFWLFWILAGILGVVSLVLSILDVSVTLPKTGEVVTVKSLLSLDGIGFAADSALESFAEFKPLAVIVVMLLGVSVAEKSGLLEAILRLTVIRLPGRWVTFAIAFGGMVAHIMSDSAYLVMIPLGALAFRAAGRSPILGIVVAYVSVSAGFNASPLVTPGDAIRAALTTQAAQTVDPDYVVTPVATYFFFGASSLLLAVVITLVVELVLAKRPELATGEDAPTGEEPEVRLSTVEKRALVRVAVIVVAFVLAVVALLLIPGSPLLGDGGSVVRSVVIENISVFIALLFAVIGFAYGRAVGTVSSLAVLPKVMADGVGRIAPVIVLFFAVAQFLAYFEWTGIASVLTVHGADLLNAVDAPHLVVLLVIIGSICLLNLIITSGSAQWAILAPVVVPMMMYVRLPPEAAMAAFMIGDSVTNAVTPMSPYFVLALGFVQQYRKGAGIGTLMSFTVPISFAILVVWSGFFALWYGLGLPLGPGVHLS
ncbi:AbgT family transporter [Amycolatopsis sp. YIM 10]|uniref:AbgT family transporter n=1 Tax=Amycolatopsis sp. YIM 10 TaxID=2653857 RepID=UPI00129079A5|nr:AbgT family transporter [Amycolatopsis sp. YIM 10]QFU89444.1 p-aminobenzoyl-glutamate transport protein [Amycolatopsis sp. YIM 10]